MKNRWNDKAMRDREKLRDLSDNLFELIFAAVVIPGFLFAIPMMVINYFTEEKELTDEESGNIMGWYFLIVMVLCLVLGYLTKGSL